MSHHHTCDHTHDDTCWCHHEGERHGCCHHKNQSYADELLQLADQAWMEVLKDKIKDEINQHSAEHLKELAKLVSKTNHDRWKNLLSERENADDFKNRLRDFLNKHHA